ncbi:D-lactate dehydrogenase [Tolypocladium capitatum]|uniref:D-lactate dehydrogenase n=1 Tax=Tolypocladium capitatum TaxID=45235 RepID=A0A2K3QME1_9HYPO|nr:D-lactate dehydrogenase [Tolypocladium capitatum]
MTKPDTSSSRPQATQAPPSPLTSASQSPITHHKQRRGDVTAAPARIMVYDWDAHQQTCYRLYIEEGRSLEDIMEHMKSVHRFAPSKRAFQTQFRRWNFPPKQRPAYKNDRLVTRVKELWERNLAQREMLRVLNDEDGFDIKARELMRVRTRNRWLLRAPNREKATGLELEDEDASLEEGGSSALDEGSTLASRSVQDVSSQRTASESLQDSDRPGDGGGKGGKRRRRRRRASADPSGSAATTRFPSETTLDEARRILNLDPATYRLLRTNFQRFCQEEGVSKKTLAGVDRWEAVKARLARDIPQLQAAVWMAKDNPEPKKLALDVICTDVTKRMRNLETRMTLAEAKNLLGINPEEAREMRIAFHQVLAESRFTCKSEASPEQWEDLKRRWGGRSELVRRAMDDTGHDRDSHKARALEVMAKDVMKRIRDDKGRKDHKVDQQLPLSPAVSPHGGQPSRAVKIGRNQSSPAADQMGLGDGMASNAFDDMSEVSHASQMAFSPASSSMGAHLPISLQSQASNLSDSQDGLSQPPRVLGSSMSAGIGLESQMGSSLLLGANAQAAFMDQPYVQPQYAAAATSAPVFPQVQSVSNACAIYLRLHPSSSFVPNTSLWIATISSHSLEELHQAAVEKFPGTVCVRVEGILKDGKGRELPLPVEQDQELGAYLTHLQGAAPTFNVQLPSNTSILPPSAAINPSAIPPPSRDLVRLEPAATRGASDSQTIPRDGATATANGNGSSELGGCRDAGARGCSRGGAMLRDGDGAREAQGTEAGQRGEAGAVVPGTGHGEHRGAPEEGEGAEGALREVARHDGSVEELDDYFLVGVAYYLGTYWPRDPDPSSTLPLSKTRDPRHNTKMENMQAAWADLVKMLGKDNVSTLETDIEHHSTSTWSTHQPKPDEKPFCVVYPGSTEEVSQIMKMCHLRRIPVVGYSGGTSLEGHYTQTRKGISINFGRMNRVLALHKEDLDVVVQPAVGWEALNDDLAKQGLFFPPDPGPGAMIGGMVGTGCSGTNAYRYGTMREWVLSLTVVMADGTVIKTRQRPRKSSAGYDLTKLFIGSEGTLGLVTEATLKVTAKPASTSVAVCTFPSIRDAATCVSKVVGEGVPIAAVEILDDNQMKYINAAGTTSRSWAEAPTLFFKFAGTPAGVKEQVAQVQGLARQAGSRTFEFAKSQEEQDELWSARKDALWSTVAAGREGDKVWTGDVAVPMSRLPALMEETKEDMRRSGLRGSIVGHVGDGNFHSESRGAVLMIKSRPLLTCALSHPRLRRGPADEGGDGGAPDGQAGDRDGGHGDGEVDSRSGGITWVADGIQGEHGVGLVKRDYLAHELGETTVDAMRQIKKAFDPLCLLNCDKVVRVQKPKRGEVEEW